MTQTWQEAQEWERSWWAECVNTWEEEMKQLTYAKKMGLTMPHDFHGQRVLDVGCGPTSMLLRCRNVGAGSTVIDPCNYPQWVRQRYRECGLTYLQMKGESVGELHSRFDVALLYNVLQHCQDIEPIIRGMRKVSKEIRVFEWVNHGISPGHLQDLKPDILDTLFGGEGKVEVLNMPGLRGECYYGIFKGDLWDT